MKTFEGPIVIVHEVSATTPAIRGVSIVAKPIAHVGAAMEVVVARKDFDLPDLRLPRERPTRDWERRKYRKPKGKRK